jgi:hypothetical protein
VDAVTHGRIPLEHAKIIAKIAATGTPAQREAATSPAGQETLVELAATQDAGTFEKSADRWAATLDPEGLERDHQAQFRRRYFQVTTGPGGSHLRGFLDTITGRKLTLALEAVTGRPGVDDDRDFGQRNADALTSLATAALGDPASKPGAHVPPQISLILTEATWIAAQADRERRRRALTTFGFPATLEPESESEFAPGSESGSESAFVSDFASEFVPGTWFAFVCDSPEFLASDWYCLPLYRQGFRLTWSWYWAVQFQMFWSWYWTVRFRFPGSCSGFPPAFCARWLLHSAVPCFYGQPDPQWCVMNALQFVPGVSCSTCHILLFWLRDVSKFSCNCLTLCG